MMSSIKKNDLLVAAAVGVAAGCLIAVIAGNITQLQMAPWWVWPVGFPFFCLAWFVFAFVVSRKIPVFYQIGKFALVGGLNFLIDLGVLNVLIFFSGIAAGWFYSLFKALAFIVAVINSYLFNKFWTFEKKKIEEGVEAGKEVAAFLAVAMVGLVLNNVTASLIVNWLGPQWGVDVNAWASIGAVIAAGVGMCWSFVGYKFFVFKK